MSHYTITRVEIVNPNKDILEKTLLKIADMLGAELKPNDIVRGWKFQKEVDYLIEMDLPYGNGYGVEITESGLRVHVDEHGAPVSSEALANMIVKTYITEAIASELMERGYSVKTEEMGEEVLILATEGW